MVTLNIYLRIHNKNADSGIVWISFYVNREKINFSTSVRCEVRNWDKNRCRIKRSDENFDDKNRIIENTAARINNVFVKYRLRDRKLTRDSFLQAYSRPDDYPTFFDFVKANKSKINAGNEYSTNRSHEKVLREVKNFSPNLHFDDITSEWLIKYFSYLRNKLKNNENTAYKDLGTLKKYVLAAIKMGYIDENPFNDFRIKKIPGNYTFLTENELQVFIDAYVDGKFESKYHKVLEFFLFLCFSSLHIGDAKLLQLEQFTTDSFIYFRIKNRNKKNIPVTVPVSESLRMILKNIVGTRKKGYVFEKLPAEQTINEFLKYIAAELEMTLLQRYFKNWGYWYIFVFATQKFRYK